MSELEPLSEGPSTSSGSPLPLIAVVLGATGLIAGVVAVVLASKAGKAADAAVAEAQSKASASDVAALRTELADLNTRLIRVGDLVTPIQREITGLRGSADRFRAIETAIGEDRAAINQLATKVAELETTPARRSTAAAGSGGGAAPTPDGKYVIQSGDTFGKIAARYNTTIDAIQAVNPGVDPRRLQVGQQINLPRGN